MIRLSAIRSYGKLIERWCYRLASFPVLILAISWWSLLLFEAATFYYYYCLVPLLVVALVWPAKQEQEKEQQERKGIKKDEDDSDTTTTSSTTRTASTATITITSSSCDQSTTNRSYSKLVHYYNRQSSSLSSSFESTSTSIDDHDVVVNGMPPSSASSCCLLEIPTEVLVSICNFLHPRDVTKLCCLNKTSTKQFGHNNNQIWKSLWYRDYGNVLLKWHVGREVFHQSLSSSSSCTDQKHQQQQSLEERLSQHLNGLSSSSSSSPISLKEFYFVFGEIYVDYLVAGRNNPKNNNNNTTGSSGRGGGGCYLGLHGHLLDFTSFAQYHPGLDIDDVLLECGQDATTYFEELPHSRGARAIASLLAVIVNKSCCCVFAARRQEEEYGLAMRTPPDNLHQLLRISNSRPVTLRRDRGIQQQEEDFVLFPKRHRSPTQRPPTLQRIRKEWDQKLQEQRRLLLLLQKHSSFGVQQMWQSIQQRIRNEFDRQLEEQRLQLEQQQQHQSGGAVQQQQQILQSTTTTTTTTTTATTKAAQLRVYYDPLRQQWITWDAAKTLVSTSTD